METTRSCTRRCRCLPRCSPSLSESSTRIVLLAHQFGLLLGKADERLSVGKASGGAAEALHVPEGSPVMVLDRVVRTIDGRAVEWRLGQCRVAASYLAQIHLTVSYTASSLMLAAAS